MNKKEINEIKKRFKKDDCTFTRMSGCYVDGGKNKVTQFHKTFLNLEEEEMFKYLEVAKKTLSGTLGNHLMELSFPLDEELNGQNHKFLLGLRECKLKNEDLVERFFDLVIEHYEYSGNYLILIFHDIYDIPVRTEDQLNLDESEEIYEYLLCAICPVTLSKPGLGYLEATNEIGLRLRDWIVSPPDCGFVFPAFTDRSTDIHSVLMYTKNPKELSDGIIHDVLGCEKRLTATEQKEAFCALLENTLQEECSYETVKEIHDKIQETLKIDEELPQEEEPEPVELSKEMVKDLFQQSGVSEEKIEQVDKIYEDTVGNHSTLYAQNVVGQRNFEVKTYDVVLHVKPEKAAQIKAQVIDGQKCLVIPMDDNENVNVNGIHTTV